MDVLQDLPRDTANIRLILFQLPMPFSLNISDYNFFWPLIDNFYSIRQTCDIHAKRSRGVWTPAHKYHYVICRFKRMYTPSIAASGNTTSCASTTKRAAQSCNLSFQLLKFDDHVEFYPIKDSASRHDHSLDEMDANKRNSLIRGLAQKDIAKGYAPAAVIGSLRGKGQADVRKQLVAAGGAYLTRQDAINSGASWRLANPNALFATRDLKDDISRQSTEAFRQLDELKWVSKPISAYSLDGTVGHGIVFAAPARLDRLA
jgi:hypothetical protein